MPGQLARAMTDAALEIGEAAANSAVTIAHRLPILAQPGSAGLAEWQICASEKAAAVWDGAIDAAMAWQATLLGALFAPPTPLGAAHHAMALARVASRPAHVCVRANAARFGRD